MDGPSTPPPSRPSLLDRLGVRPAAAMAAELASSNSHWDQEDHTNERSAGGGVDADADDEQQPSSPTGAAGGAGAAYGTPPTLRDPASPDTPDTAFVVGAGNPENAASGLPHDARGTSDLHENIRVLFSDEDAPDDKQRGDELV